MKVSTPHELEVPEAASQGDVGVKGETRKSSTSLYLSPAVHRAIRMHAAERGIRPHRIYDLALKAFFEANGLGDFDKLNAS